MAAGAAADLAVAFWLACLQEQLSQNLTVSRQQQQWQQQGRHLSWILRF
jgi:hypothetical protein